MNFDFLKDLGGLNGVYENCTNAEKLVNSIPDASIMIARKSAETIAKFVSLAAHTQQVENMTFVEILSDPTFRNFIRNKNVLDAFHYIRKNGNAAVHGDCAETTEDALSVLQDLHYVAGETARLLGLVNQYPQFDSSIGKYPDEQYEVADNINEKAMQMFLAYVERYNASIESEQYVESSWDNIFEYSITGKAEFHENLVFERKPKQPAVVLFLQEYLLNLLRLSIVRSPENEPDLDYPVILDIMLIIDCKEAISSKDQDAFVNALKNDLPEAYCFVIDCTCSGVFREFLSLADENRNETFNLISKDPIWNGAGMLDKMESFKRRESFIYKLAIFYPDSGEFEYKKIANGKDIDIRKDLSAEILSAKITNWYNWDFSLFTKFDYQKYHEILNALRHYVKETLPADEFVYTESEWESVPKYYNADEDSFPLVFNAQWCVENLQEIEKFLVGINEILTPISDIVELESYGHWENKSVFAYSTITCDKTGFHIVGTSY